MMIDEILEAGIAHEVSLVGTFSALWLSVLVLGLWGKEAFSVIFVRQRAAAQWMLLGVAAMYLGSFGDNAYWGYAWISDYLGLPARDWWFSHGVISNIFFRQTAATFSAYCHLKSFVAYREAKGIRCDFSPGMHLFWSLMGGVVFVGGLKWYESLS